MKLTQTEKAFAIITGVAVAGWLIMLVSVYPSSSDIEQNDHTPEQVTQATSSQTAETSVERSTSEIEKPKVMAFSDVDKLLSKLSRNNIGTLRPWRNSDGYGWMSSTPYYRFGNPSTQNGLENNLAYYLESDNPHYISQVKVMLNINNSDESAEALRRYAKLGRATLKAIGTKEPSGFVKALQNGAAFEFEDSSMNVVNEVHHDRINWYKFTISTK